MTVSFYKYDKCFPNTEEVQVSDLDKVFSLVNLTLLSGHWCDEGQVLCIELCS